MASDIELAGSLGADGIVIGLLREDGSIDVNNLAPLLSIAKQFELGVTFHRAFDQASDPKTALENIISLQCERLLTSGLAPSAELGLDNIEKLVNQANDRISIMAGAGVTPNNVLSIIRHTGVNEVHLSGKSTRQSNMKYITENAKMGANGLDDYAIPVTDESVIIALQKQLTTHN
jgi:copper homeostasis protein